MSPEKLKKVANKAAVKAVGAVKGMNPHNLIKQVKPQDISAANAAVKPKALAGAAKLASKAAVKALSKIVPKGKPYGKSWISRIGAQPGGEKYLEALGKAVVEANPNQISKARMIAENAAKRKLKRKLIKIDLGI